MVIMNVTEIYESNRERNLMSHKIFMVLLTGIHCQFITEKANIALVNDFVVSIYVVNIKCLCSTTVSLRCSLSVYTDTKY